MKYHVALKTPLLSEANSGDRETGLFYSQSARCGSSLAHIFIGCIKLESASPPSPRNGIPCLAKNLRFDIILRRHSLLSSFAESAVMTAFYQHLDRHVAE